MSRRSFGPVAPARVETSRRNPISLLGNPLSDFPFWLNVLTIDLGEIAAQTAVATVWVDSIEDCPNVGAGSVVRLVVAQPIEELASN